MTSARAFPSTPRMLRTATLGVTAAAMALGLSVSAANAASDFAHRAPRATSSTWGSGPITISLIEAARHEAPVRGVDPALAPGRQDMPLQAVAVSYHPTSIPLPVAYRPARAR